ncbi:carbon-nitrogen family hydrolase [Alkalibacillus salilacus]|uniref:Amidohydrolase n=1 Tax=Alkalibacillus salilacus TaxID=284582 RepID=A0ABT9VBX4_9BACI|nr:carbon-nitrogen family hydrolase [Alkalibacillus salilacus]MDQ0158325.1 putative amidohydrolase [Alkalibacillus salilacus]
MNFSVFQMDIVPGDPEANRQLLTEWIDRDVEENSPDTIVIPEMWTTAYTLPELEDIADQDGEPTISFLKDLATKHHVNIVGGSIANKKEGGIYNTAVVINREGELVYQYDKAHLVPMLNEHHYLTGGEKPAEVFELDGVKFGLIICYDLRFPELIRPLALEGAQVLCVVAEWPAARRKHWRSLQIARAIENQMYVVSSNRIGEYDGQEFSGNSMVVDPWGDVLAEGSNSQEETLSLRLDLEKVKKVRHDVPIFDSRVPEIYKKDRGV